MDVDELALSDSGEALGRVLAIFGSDFVSGRPMRMRQKDGKESGHVVMRVICRWTEEYAAHLQATRLAMPEIGWQTVVIGEDRFPYEDKGVCARFGVAPLIRVDAKTGYHVTPVARTEIIGRVGLLRSNPDRQFTTGYLETEGKIHLSESLESGGIGGDGATFWVAEFKRKYGGEYDVLCVDLSSLSDGARVYRDPYSEWGFIVDGVESIPPSRIHLLPRDSYSVYTGPFSDSSS